MNCPKCNSAAGNELSEEVDIGVGVQKWVTGYECPKCNTTHCVCMECGAWDFQPHNRWCSTVRSIESPQ